MSNLHKEIHDHFSLFTNLSSKEDNLAFVHAISEFYSGDATPVGGHYGAVGHWWLEGANGEIIDPFNSEPEWPYDAHQRGNKELEKAINQNIFADNIFDHSADILATVVADNTNEFTFESKIGEEDDDFDADFEDDFDFLDEPEPQGPRL